ncbi:hypothetical protein D3C85_939580 [compost metagenome]
MTPAYQVLLVIGQGVILQGADEAVLVLWFDPDEQVPVGCAVVMRLHDPEAEILDRVIERAQGVGLGCAVAVPQSAEVPAGDAVAVWINDPKRAAVQRLARWR